MGELRELQETVVEQVEREVEAAAGIQVAVLGPYPVVVDGQRTVCSLGSLQADSSRQVVCKLETPAGTPGQGQRLTTRAAWQPAGSVEVRRTAPVVTILTYAPGQANSAQERALEVSQQVAQLWQAHVIQQAATLNEEGRYRDARGYVANQLRHFRHYCRGLPGTRPLVAELKQLLAVAGQAWSPRAQKEVLHQQYKQQRNEDDHRAAPRASWDTYLPAPDGSA